MSLVYSLYVGVPAATILIHVALAYWIGTRHRHVRGSEWFVLGLLLGTAWMGAQLAHLLLREAELQILLATFATKFAVWSFLAHVVFASRYTETDFHERTPVRVLLGVVLLGTLLPTWMAPFEGLFYADWIVRTEPIHFVAPEPTIGYALFGIALAAVSSYGQYRLIRYMLATPRGSGTHLALLVLGSLSVMIAIALGNLGVFPIEEGPNAQFGVLPYAVLVSLALFRFRLFEIRPVARNAVVEDLRDPVLVLDDERRLVDYNPAAAEVLPDVGEGVGRPFDDLCPELADHVDVADGVDDPDAPLTLTVDGHPRHLSVNVSRVGEDDGVGLYSILLRDVTDLERSRWQLTKQNERLELVASTVSHDLRNPITVADGQADLLEECLDEVEDDHGAGDHLEKIRDHHDRMADIVEDVLAITRGGQTVEDTESVSLAAAARDAWENVETGTATLSVRDDDTLQADRSKLLSVFENLFRNAVEHCQAGVAVEVGTTANGFYVADDGPGIPAEDRDRVFESGYSTDDDGTGLGLAIVRTMAESHGWTVGIDDADDGTKFVVSTVGDPADVDDASLGRASTRS